MIIAFILSLPVILSTIGNSLCSIATGRDSVGDASGQTVTKIHDGDTFWIGERKIRIAGVDAPESKQPWGPEATDALSAKILGKQVQVECKGKSYDREVCTVSLGGEDIARWLARNGHAFDEPRYSKKAYAEDEKLARAERLGVWGIAKRGGVRPWKYRHKKKSVIKKMAGFLNKRKRN